MSNKLTYEELERKIERLEKEVDDRKRTEKELQEERDRAQRYLEIAGVILVALNSDQTVQLCLFRFAIVSVRKEVVVKCSD